MRILFIHFLCFLFCTGNVEFMCHIKASGENNTVQCAALQTGTCKAVVNCRESEDNF